MFSSRGSRGLCSVCGFHINHEWLLHFDDLWARQRPQLPRRNTLVWLDSKFWWCIEGRFLLVPARPTYCSVPGIGTLIALTVDGVPTEGVWKITEWLLIRADRGLHSNPGPLRLGQGVHLMWLSLIFSACFCTGGGLFPITVLKLLLAERFSLKRGVKRYNRIYCNTDNRCNNIKIPLDDDALVASPWGWFLLWFFFSKWRPAKSAFYLQSLPVIYQTFTTEFYTICKNWLGVY